LPPTSRGVTDHMTKLKLAALAAMPLVLTACGQTYDSVTD
jgi:hypothetical protein